MKILHTSYFWRTFFSYAILILLGTGLIGLQQVVSIGRIEKQKDAVTLQAQTALLAKAVQGAIVSGKVEELAGLGDIIARQTGMRVTIIKANGEVITDSMEEASQMDNHLRRPEVQLAIARQSAGEVERYSRTLNKHFVYRALPVLEDGMLLGVVRIARAREDLDAFILTSQLQVIRNCLVILLVLLLAAFILVWKKTETVELLTSATEAIASGDFERRVPESRALGMKRLADAINQMARKSALRMASLTSDRNRLATIFTGMVEGVIDVDPKLNIIHINDAAARLLGLKTEQALGKPVWQEIRNQKFSMALDEAVRTRSVIKTQIDFLRKNSRLVIELYVASLSDDDNNPIGAIVVLHDVTEIRYLERIRTDFVANASHELKTPITAIRGLSETVVSDENVDRETLVRFMGRIHAQSIRLSQLIGDLMTISRLEADTSLANFTRLNMTDLVARSLKTSEVNAEQKKQQLIPQLSAEKYEVRGDAQNLSQLVDNLIDNAIKYTPEQGTVEVRLRQDAADIVLEVEDSGIGISPAHQERVFERFYRVDKARSQSLGGTGLGLSIVRNIAERHGGSVDVKSQPGKGSVFIFRMPLSASAS